MKTWVKKRQKMRNRQAIPSAIEENRRNLDAAIDLRLWRQEYDSAPLHR